MYKSLKQEISRYRRMARWYYALKRSRTKLKRIDQRPIPSQSDEIRLFTMARNEALRLPYFLKYYFERGVDRIFFIDNNSTDETARIALDHERVHVFQTKESFKYYYFWMENLLQHYGKTYWCLGIDLDEFLVYPQAETVSIRHLTEYLEKNGYSAMYGLMLDMYAGTDLKEIAYQSGEDPLKYCQYFDTDFDKSDRELYNEKLGSKFQSMRFSGGMRKRLFGVEPNLTKVPLFKYGSKIYTAAGMHAIDGAVIADIRGAVLHFKYLQDFVNRTIEESQRGQHAGGAALYKPMAEGLKNNTITGLYHPESVKYEDTAQLVALGMLQASNNYEKFCRQMASR
ncbi:MAG: glycosyltransferase family 2 protein [Desulfobacteraceae bacterium]|jgi:hypothetical protein